MIKSKTRIPQMILKSSRTLIIVIATISLLFYITGLFTPLYTSTRFYFFSKESNLVQSILLLFNHREVYLGILILIFTVLLPLTKYCIVFFSLFKPEKKSNNGFLRFITNISKWSMLDVFVVAVLLLNMKFDSRIIDMQLGQGIIWFSLSIILLLICMSFIEKASNHEENNTTLRQEKVKIPETSE